MNSVGRDPGGERLARGRHGRGDAGSELPAVLVDLIDPDPHVAGLAAVGRPQDAGLLELVHDPGRPPVADPQLPLQERGGPALVLDAGDRRVLELRVPLPCLGCALAAWISSSVGPVVLSFDLLRNVKLTKCWMGNR